MHDVVGGRADRRIPIARETRDGLIYCSVAGTKVTPRYCSPKQWRNTMISKCAIAILTIASMTGAAAAQTATNQAVSATSATTHKEGEWSASKLAGVDVYNEANEKIGNIHDVILDRSGKVANVILGVGGVLGLGASTTWWSPSIS
ncbi:2-methylaconitate cis-trans-isomerase PrpF [Bradyrhizobium japonicum]